MICDSGLHRRRHAQGLMDTAEIVIRCRLPIASAQIQNSPLPDPLAHFSEKNGTVAAARIAASSVLNKLTASLPMRPWRSSEAPRTLSKNIPAVAAPRQFGRYCHGSSPTAIDIPAITAADKMPASAPIMLTAPLVPVGTGSQVVIRRGWRFAVCPSSLATVAAPASAKAATIASRNSELRCENE